MKKCISLLLVLLMVLSLGACGKQSKDGKKDALTWQEQYDLGIRYLSEGNYEEARLAFEAAIEIDPKRSEAYVGAAEAYIALGQPEKAQEVLSRGLANAEDTSQIETMMWEYDFYSGKSSETTEPVEEAEPTFSASDFDESGTCGDDAYWGYNIDEEELIIWGSGEMDDYESIPYEYASDHYYSSAPWGKWNLKIQHLKIYGISYIGENAFVEDYYTLKTVLISGSVTHIGNNALDGWWNGKYMGECESVEFTGTKAQLYAIVNEGNDFFREHEIICSDGYVPAGEIQLYHNAEEDYG